MATQESPAQQVAKALQRLLKDSSRKHVNLRKAAQDALDALTELEKNPSGHHLNPHGIPTDTVVLDRLANKLVLPFKYGCETRSSKLLATSLDALQRIMGHGYIRGAALDEEVPDGSRQLITTTINFISVCFDFPDDSIQLQIIKALHTAVASGVCDIHEQNLMNCVRTIYNVYLISRSDVNQKTAKTNLTQMLHSIFQRMELRMSPDVVIGIDDTFDEAELDKLDSRTFRKKPDSSSLPPAGSEPPSAPVVASASPAAASPVPVAVPPPPPPVVVVPPPGESPAPHGQPPQLHAPVPRSALDGGLTPVLAARHATSTRSHSPMPGEPSGSDADSVGGADNSDLPPTPPATPDPLNGPPVAPSSRDDPPADLVKEGENGHDNDKLDDGEDLHLSAVEPEPSPAPVAAAAAVPVASAPASSAKADAAAKENGHAATPPPPSGSSSGGGRWQQADDEGHYVFTDCFMLFRALCQLSMKDVPKEATSDMSAIDMRSKILSLELLLSILENSGPVFRSCDKFINNAIKKYLCMSLLINGVSTNTQVFKLSLNIFLSLVGHFKDYLKTEIGVFYSKIFLVILESPNSPFQQKWFVLKVLLTLCRNPQALVDLFVNYDCDLDGNDIYESIVHDLSRLAQSMEATTPNEHRLQTAALECLVLIMKSLVDWSKDLRIERGAAAENRARAQSQPASEPSPSLPLLSSSAAAAAAAASGGPRAKQLGALSGSGSGADHHATPPQFGKEQPPPDAAAASLAAGGDGAAAAGGAGGSEADSAGPHVLPNFHEVKQYKLAVLDGVQRFNRGAKKGMQYILDKKLIDSTPESVAKFLRYTEGLDKRQIGDFLGEADDFNKAVMHAFVDLFSFTDMHIDIALRHFLYTFRLPGEAQKIDRLMEKFAERYFATSGSTLFYNADAVYILSFATIMLATDLHSPHIKNKMSKADFINYQRKNNDGRDFDKQFLSDLYDRIAAEQLKTSDDADVTVETDELSDPKQRKARFEKEMERTISQSKQLIKGKSKDKSIYYRAKQIEHVKPMFSIAWGPALAAFSVLMEHSEEAEIVRLCLDGFKYCIRVSCTFYMELPRNTFVTTLAKFTNVNNLREMKQKNIDSIKALLDIAPQEADYLQDSWLQVLRCISQLEQLQVIGQGAKFSELLDESGGGDRHQPHQKLLKPPAAAGAAAASAPPGRTLRPTSSASGHLSYEENNAQFVARQIADVTIDKVFHETGLLNSDAIEDFVRALCAVSMDEVNAAVPRMFSLQRLVELAHFNMNRIRLVWSRIWKIMADHFVKVGCNGNQRMSMYAIDSLKQLAMKFLEKNELANYHFQKEFLKPFEQIMSNQHNPKIRDMIIRCLSNMILSRAHNIKSGWKSILVVLTLAAADPDAALVRLGFETLHEIIEPSHFALVADAFFVDTVHCLRTYASNKLFIDISLKCVDHLSYCASQLAAGHVIPLSKRSSSEAAAAAAGGGAAGGDSDPQAGSAASSHHQHLHQRMAGSGGVDSAEIAATALNGSSSSGSALALSQLIRLAVSDESLGTQQLLAADSSNPNVVFTAEPRHLQVWFPLLTALAALVAHPSNDVRTAALSALFKCLTNFGSMFSAGLWQLIFRGVLLPIFDNVRHVAGADMASEPPQPQPQPQPGSAGPSPSPPVPVPLVPQQQPQPAAVLDEQDNEWLSTTCLNALLSLIDLVSHFFADLPFLLPDLLSLLAACIVHNNESLARIGATCLLQLAMANGAKLSSEQWTLVTDRLAAVLEANTPREPLDELQRHPAAVASMMMMMEHHTAGADSPDDDGSSGDGKQQHHQPALLDGEQQRLERNVQRAAALAAASSQGLAPPPLPAASAAKQQQAQAVPRTDSGMQSPTLPRSSITPAKRQDATAASSSVDQPPQQQHDASAATSAVDAAHASQQGSGEAGEAAGGTRTDEYTASRLRLIRSKSTVQLGLMEALNEIAFTHYSHLGTDHLTTLLGALESSYQFSRRATEHAALRRLFAKHQAGLLDLVLRKETTVVSCQLRILFRMYSSSSSSAAADSASESADADRRRQLSERRLISRCQEIMRDYVTKCQEMRQLSSKNSDLKRVVTAYTGIIIQVLKRLLELYDDQFSKHLPEFYALFTDLMLSESSSVRTVLRSIFLRIGKMQNIS